MAKSSFTPPEPPTLGPVKDPTANVLDLVEAAIRRQDDLRQLEAAHTREMRLAEAARIDAIRAVDVAAVQRASEVANQQAATLALQVSTTADAFRAALVAALEPIQKRIDDLSRAQYEAQGQKTQVVESTSQSGNRGMWVGVVVGALALGVSFMGTVGAVVFAILKP